MRVSRGSGVGGIAVVSVVPHRVLAFALPPSARLGRRGARAARTVGVGVGSIGIGILVKGTTALSGTEGAVRDGLVLLLVLLLVLRVGGESRTQRRRAWAGSSICIGGCSEGHGAAAAAGESWLAGARAGDGGEGGGTAANLNRRRCSSCSRVSEPETEQLREH